MDKIHKEPYSGCWFWEGMLNRGLPRVWNNRRPSYVRSVMSLELGMDRPKNFSTSCPHRDCLNPAHWRNVRLDVGVRLNRSTFNVGECVEVFPENKSRKHRSIRCNDHKPRGAHVVAYELKNGPVPDGMVVRHKCDNPRCVRLDHLEIGTYKDNSSDAISRGRWAHGEGIGNSKLKKEDVIEIVRLFESGVSAYRIAKMFNTSHSNAHRIVTKKTWRHLWL